MTTIAINLIDPNPYRDFSIYPIDQNQVDILKQSYATRDFGIIAVRPMAGRYQQVYGHHRIEALRQLGIATVDVKIEAIDDDQMVKEMASENATQQGNSFPAQVDSVAAIARRLAYWLLISEDDAQWNELVGEASASATADAEKDPRGASTFVQAKRALLRGDGMGERLIRGYCPTLPKSAVEGAIGNLKQSGRMAELIASVKDQVEAYLKAEEAEQVRRQAAAEKARKEAEEQERKATEAAKAAAAAAAKASAARKEAAEKEAAAAADRAAKMAELRRIEAEKEVKRRAEEAEKMEERRKASEAAAKASAEAKREAEENACLHPDCLRLLRGERHHRAWRTVVSKFPKAFPIPEQPAMIAEMYRDCDGARGKDDSTTHDDVTRWCNEQVSKANAEYRRRQEEWARQRKADSKAVKARALVEELQASMTRFSSAAKAVGEACATDPEMAAHIIDLMGYKLPSYVDSMEVSVEILRSRFGVKSNRDPKRAEKVIPEYVEPLRVK